MYYTIDRFDGAFAILIGDDDSVLKAEAYLIPSGATEGMVLRRDIDGNFFMDEQAYKLRQEKLMRMKDMLLKRKKLS